MAPAVDQCRATGTLVAPFERIPVAPLHGSGEVGLALSRGRLVQPASSRWGHPNLTGGGHQLAELTLDTKASGLDPTAPTRVVRWSGWWLTSPNRNGWFIAAGVRVARSRDERHLPRSRRWVCVRWWLGHGGGARAGRVHGRLPVSPSLVWSFHLRVTGPVTPRAEGPAAVGISPLPAVVGRCLDGV